LTSCEKVANLVSPATKKARELLCRDVQAIEECLSFIIELRRLTLADRLFIIPVIWGINCLKILVLDAFSYIADRE
jgi:hypothetical protein